MDPIQYFTDNGRKRKFHIVPRFYGSKINDRCALSFQLDVYYRCTNFIQFFMGVSDIKDEVHHAPFSTCFATGFTPERRRNRQIANSASSDRQVWAV